MRSAEIIDGHDTRAEPRSLNDRLVRDADKLWRFTVTGIAVACDWFKMTPHQYADRLEKQVSSSRDRGRARDGGPGTRPHARGADAALDLTSETRMDMFIDGRWIQAASGARHNVINPATGAVIDTVPTGDARDADIAIVAAERAFQTWKKTPVAARARLQKKTANANARSRPRHRPRPDDRAWPPAPSRQSPKSSARPT